MKTIVAAIALMFTAQIANAATCGYPPYPPYGMKMICICDQNGNNCQWIAVSK